MYTNPSKKKPLIGRRVGMLKILSRQKSGKYLCKCDCGEEIETWHSNLIQGRKKHCGCSKYADRDIKGQKFGRLLVIGKFNGSFEKWVCECECGSEKIVFRSYLISGHTRSCGCLQIEKVRETGLANKFLTDEEREYNRERFRTDVRYKKWRQDIYKRDDFTCQICGDRGVKLVAHHRDCWADFPEKRFDLDNGVTLCYDCHKGLHMKFGKKTRKADWPVAA